MYCCTPKALYNHVGGLSSTTTSVQHPLGWCDGCHRTTMPARSSHTRYRWRGERVIEPIKCMLSPHTSYRRRGERVIEPIKCMLSPHTSYRWRGERVIETIEWMGMIRSLGQWREFWPGHQGYTPTIYEKCHGIFNDHRESGPRFNALSECAFWDYSVPITITGC